MTTRGPVGSKKRGALGAAVAQRASVLDKERVADTAIPLHAVEHQAVRKVFRSNPEAGSLPLAQIRPDPQQVRKVRTSGESFDGLVASIREHGVIQPITVKWLATEKVFQVITGERRYHAATRAKLEFIPVIIRDVDDTKKSVEQLVENIQRENLNPIEEAKAFQRYLAATHTTQEQLAKTIGKSKAYVSGSLSLLEKLSRTEQANLEQVEPSDLPNKSLLLEAVRTDDPKVRAAILHGNYNRREAREAVKIGKPVIARARTRFVREYPLPSTGMTMRLTSSVRPSEAKIEEAIIEGLQEHRRRRA